jgi:hypothetical protein
MAKVKSAGNANKVSFGKHKNGSAQKSFNKHTPRPKPVIGKDR